MSKRSKIILAVILCAIAVISIGVIAFVFCAGADDGVKGRLMPAEETIPTARRMLCSPLAPGGSGRYSDEGRSCLCITAGTATGEFISTGHGFC